MHSGKPCSSGRRDAHKTVAVDKPLAGVRARPAHTSRPLRGTWSGTPALLITTREGGRSACTAAVVQYSTRSMRCTPATCLQLHTDKYKT